MVFLESCWPFVVFLSYNLWFLILTSPIQILHGCCLLNGSYVSLALLHCHPSVLLVFSEPPPLCAPLRLLIYFTQLHYQSKLGRWWEYLIRSISPCSSCTNGSFVSLSKFIVATDLPFQIHHCYHFMNCLKSRKVSSHGKWVSRSHGNTSVEAQSYIGGGFWQLPIASQEPCKFLKHCLNLHQISSHF